MTCHHPYMAQAPIKRYCTWHGCN